MDNLSSRASKLSSELYKKSKEKISEIYAKFEERQNFFTVLVVIFVILTLTIYFLLTLCVDKINGEFYYNALQYMSYLILFFILFSFFITSKKQRKIKSI